MKKDRLENIVLTSQIEKKNESNKENLISNLIEGEAVIGVKLMLKLWSRVIRKSSNDLDRTENLESRAG